MSIISAGGAVTGAGEVPFDPRDYFNTVLYTGNGSTLAVTGVGFQPDFVWIKERSGSADNAMYDVVRGVQKQVESNTTAAETTESTGLTAFGSDGFTVGSLAQVNTNTDTYVAWNWKANGAGVSNTAGTISSTVSANTESGFSIVAYPGNSVSNATVGHGLSAAPELIFIKSQDHVRAWLALTTAVDGSLDGMNLNGTAGKTDQTMSAPNTSVFVCNNSDIMNSSLFDYIAYCFHSVTDFSKIGVYTGNGSATGPSVTTDFQPTFLMIKRTNSTGDWVIHDSARDATNPRTAFLKWNTADAEATGNDVDFNATSFQIKSTSATINASGGIYIYMCIA